MIFSRHESSAQRLREEIEIQAAVAAITAWRQTYPFAAEWWNVMIVAKSIWSAEYPDSRVERDTQRSLHAFIAPEMKLIAFCRACNRIAREENQS